MSDTPRTDAELWSFPGPMKVSGGINVYVHARTARQLERELNAANEQIKRLKEARDDIFLLAQKHAPEYWLDAQTAFDNWRKSNEAKP